MRKNYKIILIAIVAVFIIIQFFRPAKNLGNITSNHIFEQVKLPSEIKTMITNSCLDCHSNQTNYLWYHEIAPVSWIISSDIKSGKEKLNFSEWGKMNAFDRIGALDNICDEVKSGDMPIEAYVIMHKKARLTEAQRKTLCDWTKKLGEQMIGN